MQQSNQSALCPVGESGCKHAVAVVAEYLELLGRNQKAPLANPEDPRWAELEGADAETEIDDEETEEYEKRSKGQRTGRLTRTQQAWDDKIRSHIQAKSREELVDVVLSLTRRFPEIHEEFRERIALGEGNVDRLVKQARQELQRVTSEPGWKNGWTGEGSIPDYSRLKHRLERLFELGHPDAVVQLGPEIIEDGMEQIGQSNDEGETASAFAECLPVVFKAVAASSLPPHQKLLFAIDAGLQDEYDVIGEAAEAVFGGDFKPAAWSAVADELVCRLKAAPKSKDADSFRSYHRDRISDWLAEALSKAKRSDEVLALYESEARKTDSYERLVGFLVDQKRYDDAERWAREGIERTWPRLPGIASALIDALSKMARARGQWDIVAAHSAWRFFDRPGGETFRELIKTAEQAGCQEKVRQFALQFLETGILTKGAFSHDKHDNGSVEWPLPTPDYLLRMLKPEERGRAAARPHYDVLIDVAIAEKRPDDVLRSYDAMCADEQRRSVLFRTPFGGCSDRVAEAVLRSHPERSLEIYRQRVNENLTHASTSAYEIVASYLRKMRPIMKSLNRQDEWAQLLADIRLRYRNRPRFMEILDRLDDRTIVQRQQDKR